VRPIPGKTGLWRSDHASDPLHGTFDAWTAFVVLDHQGNLEAALMAAHAEGIGQDAEQPDDDRFPPIETLLPTGPTHSEPRDADVTKSDDVPLFLTADALRAGPHEPPPPIIEGVLLRGATLVHGPAKKGKSWLLLQMALAVDEGANFLDRHTSRHDGLYIGAEDTPARFKSRLERMFARGTLKFMDREALTRFAKMLHRALGDEHVTVERAVTELWQLAGRPTLIVIDTQEVFETILGITHGKPGDSITRRDYQATSSYDGIGLKLGVAVVLVGHWGEIKSIEKATHNPHECLNTTKARLAGVTTSITLGPLPNQEPGESTRDMQLSIRSRDLPGGDQFLWVNQDADTGVYKCLGTVRDVLVTEAQAALFGVLLEARKAHGADHWLSASDLADELDCSVNNVRHMVARVRRAAKAKGRKVVHQGFELESRPNKGYRLK
jgi:biotin operon repressor